MQGKSLKVLRPCAVKDTFVGLMNEVVLDIHHLLLAADFSLTNPVLVKLIAIPQGSLVNRPLQEALRFGGFYFSVELRSLVPGFGDCASRFDCLANSSGDMGGCSESTFFKRSERCRWYSLIKLLN